MRRKRVNKMSISSPYDNFPSDDSSHNDDDTSLAGAGRSRGFSFIEVLVGVTLIAISMLGLAQLFAYSILINGNSDQLTNATFLAQQQVDSLRNLTQEELSVLAAGLIDEFLNPNSDGIIDYRRITRIQAVENSWRVRVWVFPWELADVDASTLIASPITYRVKAEVSTLISR